MMETASFWQNTDRPPADARVLWVGAGTKDTGLSFTQLTFQITHATDADTNAERNYIMAELTNARVIEGTTSYRPGQAMERVNRYITDGEVTLANLVDATRSGPR
jgi:LssY C-terminus